MYPFRLFPISFYLHTLHLIHKLHCIDTYGSLFLAPYSKNWLTTKEDKDEEEHLRHTNNVTSHDYAEIISTLPTREAWVIGHTYQCQGFWFPRYIIEGLLSLQANFKGLSSIDDTVILASHAKSGTTWLMALTFAIKNRFHYDYNNTNHPLLTANPHQLVPILEFYAIKNREVPNLNVFATHIPYTLLPESVRGSGSKCRFVYVLHDPKDVFISYWCFVVKHRENNGQPPLSLEDAFMQFCDGFSSSGPYWDHLLGYWKASLESPEKVMVLKYEDRKKKPFEELKKLADFIGHPFSVEEETKGVIEKIMSLCSFENLSNLEVNKTGTHDPGTPFVVLNNVFFRIGKSGCSKNLLTKEMAERLDLIIADKLRGSGLTLQAASDESQV